MKLQAIVFVSSIAWVSKQLESFSDFGVTLGICQATSDAGLCSDGSDPNPPNTAGFDIYSVSEEYTEYCPKEEPKMKPSQFGSYGYVDCFMCDCV